jgi:hypothetical protein
MKKASTLQTMHFEIMRIKINKKKICIQKTKRRIRNEVSQCGY